MNLHDLILVKCLTQKKCLTIQRLLFSSHLHHTFTGQSTRYFWEPKRVHPSPQPHCSPRTLQASQMVFLASLTLSQFAPMSVTVPHTAPSAQKTLLSFSIQFLLTPRI